ncbi:MAG: hypothetical protein WC390_08660 [Sulfurimonas sp.]|jgi:hypothetical protein
MHATATLTNGECSKHSGVCEAVADLKEAKKDQDKINVRIFDALEQINGKLAWLLGGVSVLGVIITLTIMIFSFFRLVPHNLP